MGRIRSKVTCPSCNGKGFFDVVTYSTPHYYMGADQVDCEMCNGRGWILMKNTDIDRLDRKKRREERRAKRRRKQHPFTEDMPF